MKSTPQTPTNAQSRSSSSYEVFSFDGLPAPDIIPQRSPTVSVPRVVIENANMDTDSGGDPSNERLRMRDSSEAARYLRQFQSSTTTMGSARHTSRSSYYRMSGSMSSNTPSLTHTPTSSASTSRSYTPSNRPLQSRTDPNGTSFQSRSVDLVTPSLYDAVDRAT